jgi:hypothetical protein
MNTKPAIMREAFLRAMGQGKQGNNQAVNKGMH